MRLVLIKIIIIIIKKKKHGCDLPIQHTLHYGNIPEIHAERNLDSKPLASVAASDATY